jgi:hypothetical protein
MSGANVGLFIRRWWFVGVALVGLGANQARLEAAIDNKAPASDVTLIRTDITAIKNQLDDMASRQRQYFCAGKEIWCR